MYNSLESWCVFPVAIYAYAGHTASGDVKYAKPMTTYGYIVDKEKCITDKYGKEYISMSQVYFPPTVAVTDKDKIAIDASAPCEIHRINRFRDGTEKAVSILVVYL